jgi:hypothetical protein
MISFTFKSKEDAEKVIKASMDIVIKYGSISLAEVKALLGTVYTTYEDDQVGWKSLENLSGEEHPEGYILNFPTATKL